MVSAIKTRRKSGVYGVAKKQKYRVCHIVGTNGKPMVGVMRHDEYQLTRRSKASELKVLFKSLDRKKTEKFLKAYRLI